MKLANVKLITKLQTILLVKFKHCLVLNYVSLTEPAQNTKNLLPVGSESFSSQFDFCSSIPCTDFDLLDRDLQLEQITLTIE